MINYNKTFLTSMSKPRYHYKSIGQTINYLLLHYCRYYSENITIFVFFADDTIKLFLSSMTKHVWS